MSASSRGKLSLISCAVGGVMAGWAAKMGMEKVVNRLKGTSSTAGGDGYTALPSESAAGGGGGGDGGGSGGVHDSPMGSSVDPDADERVFADDDFDLDGSATTNAKVCNFFVRTGRCASGHDCRYSHRFSACAPNVQRRVLLGRRAGDGDGPESARRTVALTHPGEMGISIAACLLRRGHRVLWCSEGRSSATRLRAESFGLVEMESLEAMVAEADVVISLVPPAAAMGMARAVAAAWAAVVRAAGVAARVRTMVPPVFLDLNPLSPSSIERMREMLEEQGMTEFVDGCLVGPPGWDMGTTRLYLSGGIYVQAIRALFEDVEIPPPPVAVADGASDADAPPGAERDASADAANSTSAGTVPGGGGTLEAKDAGNSDADVPDWHTPRSPNGAVSSNSGRQPGSPGAAAQPLPPPAVSSTSGAEGATVAAKAPRRSGSPANLSPIRLPSAISDPADSVVMVDPDSIRPAYFQIVDMHKKLGSASGLAMTNAAWVKGSTALLISVHALAESLGVRRHLEEEWRRSQPGLSLFSRRKIPIAARKAWSFEGEMKQIAETYDTQGLPSAFHHAAAAVYKGLSSFKDIVRNSLNTRAATPRQRSGSMGGGLTLPAVVKALCFIMRNKGLRTYVSAAKLSISRRHSANASPRAGSTAAAAAGATAGADADADAETHEASSTSDSDDDVVFAEL